MNNVPQSRQLACKSILALLLVTIPAARAIDDESTFTEFVELRRLAADVLSGIRSERDATAMSRKLSDLTRKWQPISKAFADVNKQRVAELEKSRGVSLAQLNRTLEQHYLRISKQKSAYLLLNDYFPIQDIERKYVTITRVHIRGLSQDAELFKALTGQYPQKLSDLTQAVPLFPAPLLKEDDLKDEWGNPIQYERHGKKNKTGGPDIWSSGPPRQEGKELVIGNWENPR